MRFGPLSVVTIKVHSKSFDVNCDVIFVDEEKEIRRAVSGKKWRDAAPYHD